MVNMTNTPDLRENEDAGNLLIAPLHTNYMHNEIQCDTDMRISSVLKRQAQWSFRVLTTDRYHLPALAFTFGLIAYLVQILNDDISPLWVIVPGLAVAAIILLAASTVDMVLRGFHSNNSIFHTKQEVRIGFIVFFWVIAFILVQRNQMEISFSTPVLMLIISVSLLAVGKDNVHFQRVEPAVIDLINPSDAITEEHLIMLSGNPVIKKWMLEVLDRRENLTYSRLVADRAHIANSVNEKLISIRNRHVRNVIEE